MKKKTIFASVLVLLLLATSTAFACPPGFTEFTTTGVSWPISWPPEELPGGRLKYTAQATGTVRSDCTPGEICFDGAGFTFTEWILANPVGSKARNGGIMTITASGGAAVFEFQGTADASSVHGTFRALSGTGEYAGLSGGGRYEGIPDAGEGFWVRYFGRLSAEQ